MLTLIIIRSGDMRSISFACILMIVGCGDSTSQITTNNSSLEGMSFLEALDHLNDPDEFRNCDSEGLKPLEEVWSVSKEVNDRYVHHFVDATGDNLALKAIEFAENLDIELPARTRDRIVMFQFKLAAEQGSPIAMNEIGNSLLHCYQHVDQNLEDALRWLERAAANGDDYAMRSMAKMHILGMTDIEQPRAVAEELLLKCAELGNEECLADISTSTTNR